DTRLGRPVALKILSPEQSDDEETLLRFQNEAQSAARLDHDNIARVHYVGEDRGLHYIAFEFVEGLNIRALVEQKGPLSLAEAVSYTLQIAEALAHADARKVVHRDVKPSNVLITPEGRVKLIDMGLARLREDRSAADLTASGVTLGTFDYISPEQARDPRTADIRSDIYSLGCTFFYMLAGRPPFPEGTVLQKLLQHQGDQPPDLREFRPELPEETNRLLRKMLAKDPRHRFRDSEQLVGEFASLAEQVGLQPIGYSGRGLAIPPQPRVTLLQRHVPWMAPVVVLLSVWAVLHVLAGRDNQASLPRNYPPPIVQKENEPPPEEPVAGSPGNGSEDSPPSAPGDDDGSPVTPVVPEVIPEPEAVGLDEPVVPMVIDPLDWLLRRSLVQGGLSLEGSRGGLSIAGKAGPGMAAGVNASSVGVTGATVGPSEPGEVGPPVEPVPTHNGPLVVNEQGEGEYRFATLSAACSAAGDGDVIELHYNGLRQERPITLSSRDVKICAGEGYRPLVVFRPGTDETDPVKYPRSMFTLTAGRLTLTGVALELHVPSAVPAEQWSLLEIRGGQTVRLEKCSLSIRNATDAATADHQDVAFFRTVSALGADVAVDSGTATARAPAVIKLVDCIARGEAVFLQAADLQPVQLDWENGLLATAEPVVDVAGGPKLPPPGEMLAIDLRHVTAAARGLLRLADTPSAPYRLPIEIDCVNSIFMTIGGAALIEQTGTGNLSDFHEQIRWAGDHNFYEQVDTFWATQGPAGELLSEPMGFEEWKLRWGSQSEYEPHQDQVRWAHLPEPELPSHAHVQTDYALAPSTATTVNRAIGAASDGADVGFQADRLPELPVEPPVTEPPPADSTPPPADSSE
ncbi:MAG: serine/threonine protein kinase, partial [Candidatus Nealsonbacteria bacterium]|nr:serine/threonine protein kinase [Candidatus Nealsonbacteria bacterium]